MKKPRSSKASALKEAMTKIDEYHNGLLQALKEARKTAVAEVKDVLDSVDDNEEFSAVSFVNESYPDWVENELEEFWTNSDAYVIVDLN